MSAPKQKSVSSYLTIGFIGNMGSQVVSFATIIVLTPIILRYLGAEMFGLWAIAGSIMAYGGLFDFGLWGTVIKYISHHKTLNEYDTLKKFISTVMWLYTTIAILVFGLFYVLAPVATRLVSGSTSEPELFRQLFVLVGLATSIMIVGMAPMAVLRGMKHFEQVNAIDVIGTLLTAVGTVFVLRSGYGVIGIIWVNIAGIVLYFLLGQLFIFLTDRRFLCKWGAPSREVGSDIFGYSRSLFVYELANRLNSKTDEATIGLLSSAAVVTPYNIARRYSDSVQIVSKQLVKLFYPLTAELFAKNEFDNLRTYSLIITRVTTAFSIGVAGLFVIFAEPVIKLWLGADFEVPQLVILILAVASVFQILQSPLSMTLKGIAKHQKLAVYAVTFGVLNLIISILLIGQYGLIGVAIGTLIPAIFESVLVTVHLLKTLTIPYNKFYTAVLRPIFVPLVFILTIGFGYHATSYSVSGFFALVAIGFLFIAYTIIYLWVNKNSLEREVFETYLKMIQQKLNRRTVPLSNE